MSHIAPWFLLNNSGKKRLQNQVRSLNVSLTASVKVQFSGNCKSRTSYRSIPLSKGHPIIKTMRTNTHPFVSIPVTVLVAGRA